MREFCDWAGLAVSTLKTEVTGYDFARRRDLWPAFSYKGTLLPQCGAGEAFKYLGLKISLTGDTQAARADVIARTTALVKVLQYHILARPTWRRYSACGSRGTATLGRLLPVLRPRCFFYRVLTAGSISLSRQW